MHEFRFEQLQNNLVALFVGLFVGVKGEWEDDQLRSTFRV